MKLNKIKYQYLKIRNTINFITDFAKDVIDNLNSQIEYAKDPANALNECDIEFVVNEATDLIQEINKHYQDKDDVIEIALHPMSGFYVLQDKEKLLEELQDYYEELEEK